METTKRRTEPSGEATTPCLSAARIAELVGGRLVGDPARAIRGGGTLREAGPEDISWIADSRFTADLARSRAGVVLAREGEALPEGPWTLIYVADPETAMLEMLARFAPPVPQVPPGVDAGARVSPEAKVDGAHIGPGVFVGPGAIIGAGTQLHPGVYVGADAQIGRDCVLWPNVVVRERTVIGDRVTIHPNATIGADGFGYRQRGGRRIKIPQIGKVVVEDDVEIGANTCIDRARTGATRIGRGTKVDNLVQIGHNVRIGADCILVSQCGVSGSATLGDDVTLAGQVGIADHVEIGDHVVVTAQSGVLGDLPGNGVFGGSPAVDHREERRQWVALRRLPGMLRELRDLAKRVRDLESADNDRARS